MRGARKRHQTNPIGNADDLQVRGSILPQGVEIVHEWPPRRAEIEERFGELPDGVIFAWGDKIMVPSGAHLWQWLVDHEAVHLRQQKEAGGVDPWWDRYLVDDEFRLEQELEAHVAEYRTFCLHERDRNERARYLNAIAGRLSSKMYGRLITRGQAMKRIRRGY